MPSELKTARHQVPLTIADSLVEELRRAILAGKVAGGEILRQGYVAEQFGVSRIPVREALLKLEGEGLIKAVPRRGFVVVSLTRKDFQEILEMRNALEGLALELAIPVFTKRDEARALKIVDASVKGMQAADSSDLLREFESRWGEENRAFHASLYGVVERPRLLAQIENLQHLFARQLRTKLLVEGASKGLRANRMEWEQVLEEHRQLALACGRRDVAAAKSLLHQHIFGHGENLIRRMYGPIV